MCLKISSKDSKIFSFTSENREGSTSSSAGPSLSPNSEKTIPSEAPSKGDTEVASPMVAVATVIMVDTVATSRTAAATEVATVAATSHTVVVVGATKVATKAATAAAIEEVVPREGSPTTGLYSWATSASVARSLM